MRLAVDQLTMKALLALEEGALEVRAGTARPSFAIRFALAYLYAVGNGERWLFDEYWQGIIGKAGQEQASRYLAGVVRQNTVEASLNGIYRSVGIERTVSVLDAARAALRRSD